MKNNFLEKCIDSVKNLTTENEEQEIAKRVVINILIDTMNKNDELNDVIEETINKIDDLRMEKGAIMGTDIMDILDILNKYKNL